MTEFRRLPASDVGLRAPRSCTSVCGLILFVLMWAGMIAVSVVSYRMGDLNRLMYGVDYLGNVCGKGSPSLTNLDNQSWASRTALWYPITYDSVSGIDVQASMKLGICVNACPASGSSVQVYYPAGSVAPTTSQYDVLFSSLAQVSRCVPDIRTFNCSVVSSNIAELAACKHAADTVTSTLGDFYDGLTSGFNSLQAGWWVLLVCVLIAIVICFLWMFVLRRLVKPMVVITMTILVVVLAVGGYIMYHMSKSGDDANSKYYLAGAIAAWVVDFLILCVMLFVRRDIMIACDIIEEAAKVPTSLPSMMLVPPIASLFMLPFVFYFLFTSATIYTAASTINGTAPIPSFNSSAISSSTVVTTQFQLQNWRIPAEIFNLLMFLWSVGFINAIGFMTCAFCAVFWYWSNPGDEKKPEAGPCAGFTLTMKNHLGNLAIGSLLVAILEVARIVLQVFEKRLEAYAGKSDAVKCCLYCAECLLACFTRVVKFVNKNSYIVTAMTGEPFLDAAKHALDLLLGNALSVAAISVIGEYVCMFGKVLITSIVLVICYFISGGTNSDKNVILLMVVVGLATYFICCVFINVFHVCIDTVLLCYCYDLREHNGQDKPYYFPSDLAKHVERARERMKAQEDANNSKAEMEKPLNKQAA